MKNKKLGQTFYTIANIYNMIELVVGVLLSIFGFVCMAVKDYAKKSIDDFSDEVAIKLTQGDFNRLMIICLAVGLPLLVLSIVALATIRKANTWPNPSKKANIVNCVVGVLVVDPFLVLGGVFTILAAKEDAEQTDGKTGHMGLKASRMVSNTFSYLVLVIISVVWIIPFVFIVLQSFRTETATMVSYVIPKQWGLDNYRYLFSANSNFLLWYFNTYIIALACCILQTIMQLMMAYVLSRFRFKMRKPLMNVMLILGMFPGFLTMIVLYQVLKFMNLIGSNAVGGLILVSVASSGMGYYVSKGFFDTVPKSLDEAARIDGATRLQIFYKIIIPLAKPIVIYTVLTAFMGPWGDFIFARVIANNNPAGLNVAVGLWSWLQQDMINDYYTRFCAGGVIVAIPVIVIFMFLQRYYVEGVTGGAVKG